MGRFEYFFNEQIGEDYVLYEGKTMFLVIFLFKAKKIIVLEYMWVFSSVRRLINNRGILIPKRCINLFSAGLKKKTEIPVEPAIPSISRSFGHPRPQNGQLGVYMGGRNKNYFSSEIF